jgi:hypothetical protein
MTERFLFLLAVLTLAACTSPTANEPQVVELRTDRSSYGVGDTTRLTLTNQGPHAVYGALWPCLLEVEQWHGDNWQSAGNFPEVCTLGFVPRLEPGASTERGFKIVIPPFALSGGEYRFHMSLFDLVTEEPFDVFSPRFSVVP